MSLIPIRHIFQEVFSRMELKVMTYNICSGRDITGYKAGEKRDFNMDVTLAAGVMKKYAPATQITLIQNNLPCGYFRDLQIIKECFLPAFEELKDCLRMCTYIISKIEVKRDILDNPMYDAIFSVEEVNKLAADGMPFRDAYKKVGLEIEAGNFVPNKNIHHTHEGSIGNLCNDRIVGLMNSIMQDFHFEKVDKAIKALLLG